MTIPLSLKTKLNVKKEQQSDINFFKQEMTRVIFELIICKLTLLDFDANKYKRMKIKITNFKMQIK